MSSTNQNYDFVIIGAGVVGLSIAREILSRSPKATLLVLEKEATLASHASGRNSGVLHAGLYYPAQTLKARLCIKGAAKLREFCKEKGVLLNRHGKVIVASSKTGLDGMYKLYKNGIENGVNLEIIDDKQLLEIEPDALAGIGKSIFSPDTAVFSPKEIMKHLKEEVVRRGGAVRLGSPVLGAMPEKQSLNVGGMGTVGYGLLVNAAGSFADKLAHEFGVGLNYSILPFKGIYYELAPNASVSCNGNIYPVPDPNLPFLGIHFTKSMDGRTIVGPCALPALGRENYRGLENISPGDIFSILAALSKQYLDNTNGFRAHVHKEVPHLWQRAFYKDAKKLVPRLLPTDLQRSEKVGIRAQLYNKTTSKLENDFVVQPGSSSVHILNAISPAFTASLEFARYVFDEYIDRDSQRPQIGEN